LWLVTGLFSVALGMIGIFVPLLPTIAFMIFAAFCFGKSSPRLYRWLLEHPAYGSHIRDWQETGAIRPRAKRLATVGIAVAFALSVALGVSARILTVQAMLLLAVLGFIWSRPSG